MNHETKELFLRIVYIKNKDYFFGFYLIRFVVRIFLTKGGFCLNSNPMLFAQVAAY